MVDQLVTLSISDSALAADLHVTDQADEIALYVSGEPVVVTLELTEGGTGAENISTDPGNRLKRGSDLGLYVLDDLTPDPLAFYILAKG